MSTVSKPPSAKSSRARWIILSIVIVLVLLVAAAAWVGSRALAARASLESAAGSATALPALVRSGDSAATMDAANAFETEARAAASATSDPIWRLAEYMPWVGSNLAAVRGMSEVAADVATSAVVPLAGAAAQIDISGLGFVDGRIDVAPLAEAAPTLRTANEVLQSSVERLDSLPEPGLTIVADALGELRTVMREAAQLVDGLDRAAAVLPAMVGTNEPRTYLLLVLNNAEARTLGGIAGAGAVLRLEQGRVQIDRQFSSSDFEVAPESVIDLSPSTLALFEDLPGRFIQNSASALDFPETAAAAAGIWEVSGGEPVDGVIALDAVSIGYLLEATGPIEAGPFTLDAENAARTLLSEAYAEITDTTEQDAAFALVARRVFETLAAGGGDPDALLTALARAAEEHRLHVWSSHPEEQERIAGTAVATLLPADGDELNVGVFINDVTGAKLDYYATPSTTVVLDACGAAPRATVTVDWTNTVPADAATSLPAYVLGPELTVAARGETLTRVAVAGPEGWLIDDYSFDDRRIGVQTAQFDDRSVVQHEFVTAPGGSHRIVAEFTAPEGTSTEDLPIDVIATPLVHKNEVEITRAICTG